MIINKIDVYRLPQDVHIMLDRGSNVLSYDVALPGNRKILL